MTIELSEYVIDAIADAIVKKMEEPPKILNTLDLAINASDGDTNYFVGFRNGLRYSKSLIDGEEPQFESCTKQEPKTDTWSIKDVADTLAEHGLIADQEPNAFDKIKWLIEQYESEIEKCAEDRRNMPMSPTQAYLTAKIGVYGKVVADLKELIESEDRHE